MGDKMDAMYCRRCDQVYANNRLVCSECGFIMVGVTVDNDGEARLRSVPTRPAPAQLSPPRSPRGCPAG